MSTKFTRSAPSPAPAEIPLGQALMRAQQWVVLSLLHLMEKRGFRGLTPAHLSFLANLDCGATHAAAVARRMGVSRQAVYRTTRELQKLGILALADDPELRNRKIVQMTDLGMQVATGARECLAEIEAALEQKIGVRDFAKLSEILRADWSAPLGPHGHR